jgi:hypothetical protein
MSKQLMKIVGRLSEHRALSNTDLEALKRMLARFDQRSCRRRDCSAASCSLKAGGDDLLTCFGYTDLRDLLSYKESGLRSMVPVLNRRKGFDPFTVPVLRRPGHFNP